ARHDRAGDHGCVWSGPRLRLHDEFNYAPRPVIQSYSAYIARTMELNENYYLSSKAPDYVLFYLQPIDGRFPAMEDAYTLRDYLVNYHLVDTESNFLLLQK